MSATWSRARLTTLLHKHNLNLVPASTNVRVKGVIAATSKTWPGRWVLRATHERLHPDVLPRLRDALIDGGLPFEVIEPGPVYPHTRFIAGEEPDNGENETTADDTADPAGGEPGVPGDD